MSRISRRDQWKRVSMVMGGLMLAFIVLFGEKTWGAAADYAGVYSGTFHGDIEGVWTAEVQTNGAVFMLAWDTTASSLGGFSAAGSVDGVGHFIVHSGDMDFEVAGDIDLAGDVDGVWSLASAGASGGLAGQRHGASDYQAMAGAYGGIYTGDYHGTWTMCIKADGRITGRSNDSTGYNEDMEGDLVSGTTLLAISKTSGSIFYATVVSGVTSITINGTWRRSDGKNGTFDGQKTGDSCNTASINGGGGGGGGGGCFLTAAAHERAEAHFSHRAWLGLVLLIGLGQTLFFHRNTITRRK